MQKILVLFVLVFALSGCVRKISIEQGNIMTPEMVHQIHIGMTPAEVKYIMGSPVLMNTFRDNRIDYIYTFKPGRAERTEKTLILMFENNRLAQMKGNMAVSNQPA